jgi:hypothetical protein
MFANDRTRFGCAGNLAVVPSTGLDVEDGPFQREMPPQVTPRQIPLAVLVLTLDYGIAIVIDC